jgi:hypothetical protein
MPAYPRLANSEPPRHLRHAHPASDHHCKDGPRQWRHLRQCLPYPLTCFATARTDWRGHLARTAAFKISLDPRGTVLVASQIPQY